jgi:hypothetical protein
MAPQATDPQATWTEIDSLYTANHSVNWARLKELAESLNDWLRRDVGSARHHGQP